MNKAVRDLQTLFEVGSLVGLPDGQLLDRFVARREGAVFEAIVRRHGPMVWGVCRRVLRDHHDAEDAFQATFLVLARRAASVVPREKVGHWLYGVAHRTATKARATRARRRGRECQVADMPEPEAVPQAPRDDFGDLLDREVGRLPEKYRVPVVLCELEGKSHREVAEELGWPIGTVSGRLSRARAMLAGRLSRRGVPLSAGSLAVLLAQHAASAAMPPTLVASTSTAAIGFSIGRAASGLITPAVASLAEGMLKTMMLSKFKAAATVVLVLGLVSGGAVYSNRSAAGAHGAKDGAAGVVKRADVPVADRPEGAGDDVGQDRAAAKAEPDFRGRWQATRFLIDARPNPVDAVETLELLLGEGSYRFTGGPGAGPRAKGSKEGRIRVDLTKVPHEIDLIPSSGVYKGLVQEGIFEVKGDTLKLCYGMPTIARPAEFATRPNSGIYLAEFRRVVGKAGDDGPAVPGRPPSRKALSGGDLSGVWRGERAGAGAEIAFRGDGRATWKVDTRRGTASGVVLVDLKLVDDRESGCVLLRFDYLAPLPSGKTSLVMGRLARGEDGTLRLTMEPDALEQSDAYYQLLKDFPLAAVPGEK